MTENVQTQIDKLTERVDDAQSRIKGLEYKVSQQGNVLSELFLAVQKTRRYTEKTRAHQNNMGKAFANIKQLMAGTALTPPGDGDHGGDDDTTDYVVHWDSPRLTRPEPSPTPDEAVTDDELMDAFLDAVTVQNIDQGHIMPGILAVRNRLERPSVERGEGVM